MARMAAAVRMTSSPSSRPVTRVSPEARPPSMTERCEIDLSPGKRARPMSGGERRAVAGCGRWSCAMKILAMAELFQGRTGPPPAPS